MKHLVLAVAFITASFSSAFADSQLTKAANEAAIKANKTLLASKITTLDNSVTANNMQAAQTAAADVLDLMRKGMSQTNDKMSLESKADQIVTNQSYLKMEKLTHQYSQLSQDVAKNGKQLVTNAQSFMKEY